MSVDLVTNQWEPATVPQRMALDCPADILFFGGAAGSLKSHTILLDAIQERENPNLRAIIFRESYPQLTDIIDKTQRLYRPLGAVYNSQEKTWKFPSGATVQLRYLSRDEDVYEYYGHEFSFIGVDESTRHTEKRLRWIISRLRSRDPKLKKRVRWGSNPGGIGAVFHKKMFLKNACPVHQPDKCVVPGKLYTGVTWPSDGKELPMSVAFIPGRLSDHNLLGDDYKKLLHMQEGSLADQLETGCWCQLEGQFFRNWNRQKMFIPLGSIPLRWWWTYWIAIDYGFGKSYAAAGLYVRTPADETWKDGRIYKIAEHCVPHKPVKEFAKEVAERFITPEVEKDRRRNIQHIFLDPANFNANYDSRIGESGHTVADQLNEVFEQYQLACQPASNDRIGGWQLLYGLLDSGEFTVADTCPMTADSIPGRMHDEKKPGDVQKVPGDPLDDVADETRYGLYSFVNLPEKPKEEKRAEVMEKFQEDPTNTAIRLAKMDEEERSAGQIQAGSARQRMRQLMSRRRW